MAIENPRTDGPLAGLARFCHRRRRLVLLAWIVGVITVALAGTTVVIVLLGLVVMGQRLMTGVTVLVTMIAAVTLLPAFPGFTGYRLDSLRLPRRTSCRNTAVGVP